MASAREIEKKEKKGKTEKQRVANNGELCRIIRDLLGLPKKTSKANILEAAVIFFKRNLHGVDLSDIELFSMQSRERESIPVTKEEEEEEPTKDGDDLFCSEEYLDSGDEGDETTRIRSPCISHDGNEEASFHSLSSRPSSPSYGNQPQLPLTPSTVFLSPNPPWFTSPQSSNYSYPGYLPPFQTPPLHHLSSCSPLNSPVLSSANMQLFSPSPFEPMGQNELHF